MFKLQTDYALRTLIYLAHIDAQASVQEIATAYGISRDHLFKVVQQLVRLGFVVSRPGRNGGVRLGREASQMSFSFSRNAVWSNGATVWPFEIVSLPPFAFEPVSSEFFFARSEKSPPAFSWL